MKQYIYVKILFIFLCVSSLGFVGCGHDLSSASEEIRLAYCPTMESFANDLQQKNPHLILVKTVSSADALSLLAQGDVTVVLIGRLAKEEELQTDIHQKILGGGYTLISKEKSFIDLSELSSITVHTAVKQSIAEGLLPFTPIEYYSSTTEAVSEGLTDAVLIHWDEFRDEYALLVVLDGQLKAEQFRIPVLYSYLDSDSFLIV